MHRFDEGLALGEVVGKVLILMRSLKCGEVWDQTENVGFEEGSLAES